MKIINGFLIVFAVLFLAMCVVTFSVNTGKGSNDDAGIFAILILWAVNLILQIAAVILIMISFFRSLRLWVRILHCIYLIAIIAFYVIAIDVYTGASGGIESISG